MKQCSIFNINVIARTPHWLGAKQSVLVILIFITALLLRLYGLNWDQGQHLHPDERMIVMVANRISIPQADYFSPDSSLNPKFFAYGSFPIYLLNFSAQILNPIIPGITTYDYINLLGRVISAIFDSLVIFLIFKIAYLVFNNISISLIASAIYAISVFPIQLSHFYAVDTILNFFLFSTLYQLIKYHQKQKIKYLVLAGICIGLSLSTKISAVVIIAPLIVSLVVGLILVFRNKLLTRQKINFRFGIIIRILGLLSLVSAISIIVFIIFEPFALADFATFKQQILEQQAMTRDAFVFPYTLQYVNTTAYIYPLVNIFLWGLGPVISLLALLGLISIISTLIKGLLTPGNEKSEGAQLIIFLFLFTYFLITGGFAVKFMRYYLPLYPFLAIFAAHKFIVIKSLRTKIALVLCQIVIVTAFLGIYKIPNTRVTATNWIHQNIPAGSTILIEHWDDPLPLGYLNSDITQLSLPLYDSDQLPSKWQLINQMLDSGDYIIIASNRLYTPLQKLTNCDSLPPNKCYSTTAKYYQDLFSGRLGYVKVAEFTSYPTVFGISINDQSADESFTVYDHPRIQIYKKN